MAKKTPLYDEHVKLKGTVVDFAGWLLPIKYTDLVEEHNAVREKAGIFDVSHMGEIEITGDDALMFLDYISTNDITTLKKNEILYTIFCYENGTCVDDLLVYMLGTNHYYLVVNASNTQKDYEWLMSKKDGFNVNINNLSDSVSEVAIQGPDSYKILSQIVDVDLNEMKPFTLMQDVKVLGKNTMISRTGYTGEDGFEIYCEGNDVVDIWKKLHELGATPCGLGCRDTLRFEAGMPLYGHEISDEINPLEGGVGYAVKLDKKADFIGKKALIDCHLDQKRTLCALELLDKGIAREGYKVFVGSEEIGHITTGYKSPTIGKVLANALVKKEYKKLGNEVDVHIRKRISKAKMVKKFYLREFRK